MENEFHRTIYEAGLPHEGMHIPDVEKELARFRRKRKARMRIRISVAAAAIAAAVCIPFLSELWPDLGGIGGRETVSAYFIDDLGNKIFISDSIRTIYQTKRNDKKSIGEEQQAETAPLTTHTLIVPKGKGESLAVVLSDGTTVQVNSGSSITYPADFDGNGERVVTLNYGEAFFDVAHDADRPFIVRGQHCDTRVLGTRFNVQAYEQGPCNITLVEGSVAVRLPHREWNYSRLLTPGENAAVTPDEITVSQVDTQNYAAWIDGYYYYDRQSVMEILENICNRYDYRVEGRVATDDKVRFWFSRNEDMDEVVGRLSQIANVKMEVRGKRIIVK